AQQEQFRTQVVSAHNRNSSGHRWSVRTTGTVQGTHGRQLADPQRQAAPDRDDHGQHSSSSRGTQQKTASRDTQPRIVCRPPQQQLPGHSAADRVQGCSVDRLTDWQSLSCGV
ncbi:unnamed protein product, partial [Staurois parvus]